MKKIKMISTTQLEKYYTSQDDPTIKWRFSDKPTEIEQIHVVNKTGADIVWEWLMKNITNEYSLNKDSFDHIEAIPFENNYEKIANFLKSFEYDDDNIILTWYTDETIVTTMKCFTKNWDDFFHPSSDDLLVINIKRNWIIYIAHFEVLYFGHGLIEKN